MRNQNSVPNNDERVAEQLESLNLEGVVRVWFDDGNVGVVVNDDQLENVVSQLRSLNLPRVGDGFQEGGVWVSNVSRSVNDELSEL